MWEIINPFFTPAPHSKTSSARNMRIKGAQEFLNSKYILTTMYRNHLVRKDFSGATPLQTQRWGWMARPEDEQDGHLWPSEVVVLLKPQFLFPFLTQFSPWKEVERDACWNLHLSAEDLKTWKNELLTREVKRSPQDTIKKYKSFYTEDWILPQTIHVHDFSQDFKAHRSFPAGKVK